MKISPPCGLRQKAAGVSLIECLLYIALVFVVVGEGFMALYYTTESHKDLRRDVDDIVAALNLGELWRKDVRSANARITIKTNNQGQTLYIPQRGGKVIYRFADGQLQRRSSSNTSWVTFLPRVESSLMTPDPREHVTAWRWELTLKSPSRKVKIKPEFSFEAVPEFRAP